jgi:glucose-1-phosphate adenylyltransferase
VGLGPGCTARKCIIDKNSRIGANVQIINKDGVQVRPVC